MDTSPGQDEDLGTEYDNLCYDLNMDVNAKESAWDNYLKIKENYTLEGNGLHWLACSLYVSCRKSTIPTVGSGDIEGNCVSLTRLIRTSKLSLLEFFKKMKKWLDMANLPQEFRDKVERLERNFAVSTVIFKKFEPIFLDIFNNPANDPPKQNRSRKQRRLPCTVTEVFGFCWTMFVQVKGNFPAISDDLVNSYHLLLCCIDWFFSNALLSNRRDLIRPEFSGLPENYMEREYKPPSEVPCIIQLLCDKHEGLVIEAKGIKEHWWKPYIKKLFDRKTLRGRDENLTGILEIGNFENNTKEINRVYEEYVLSVGDFDERIFLGEDADIEIGTPAKIGPGMSIQDGFHDQIGRGIQQHVANTRSLCPPTPLTGRRWLKENDPKITPVSTATQSVGKLQSLLAGRKNTHSEKLLEIFKQCPQNLVDKISHRVNEMGELFLKKFVQSSEEHPGSHDLAGKRLQLAEKLYYKTLENIMLDEKQRLDQRKQSCDFSILLQGILGQDIFHKSLFACCLEIVIFSYNSQRAFPWIIEVYELPAYSFYKVIEVLIKVEEGLSRDVVKHLNHIEETVLEQQAWKSNSPLWDVIRQEEKIPSVEDVSFPNQIERDDKSGESASGQQMMSILSPMMNPALRHLSAVQGNVIPNHKDIPQSPTSAADRFMSPGSGAKRRLFSSAPEPGSHLIVNNKPSEQTAVSNGGSESSTNSSQNSTAQNKPKKTGSLALFLRKVYHLASVRLRDLCERLDVDSALRSKMWTCFEYTLINHIELLEDRHLDQIIMCSMYVMAKVTGNDKSFQDIMRSYRLQPQAQSHVYRSVLLQTRRRPGSAGSDSDKAGGQNSGSNSPNSEDRERRRAERLANIRSDSALPIPTPDSQPPTPTRLTGMSSSFDYSDKGEERSEDRGDLIKFYNAVFVVKIKEFALKFSKLKKDTGDQPPLSPMPLVRSHPLSPRRVSQKHSVYVSPHKLTPTTPHTKLLYCFSRSPAKDLRAINNMLRLNDKGQSTMKRLALSAIDPSHDASSPKRICKNSSPMFAKRLESVVLDRQQGSANSQPNRFN